MTNILQKGRRGLLKLPALLALALFGAVVPRGVWSQTPESPAPPPGEMKGNPFPGF